MKKKLTDALAKASKDKIEKRALWIAAKKAGKTAEEMQKHFDAYETAVDAEEAAQKALEDFDAANKENDVTVKELTDIIQQTVKEQLDAALPEFQKKQITEDGLKAIVAEAIKNAREKEELDLAKMDAKAMGELAKTVISEQMKMLKKENKMEFSQNSGQVEIPYSWSKGNLPTHAKQMFNIIAKGINKIHDDTRRHIKLLEISDQEIADAEKKGLALISRYQTKALNAVKGSPEGWREAHKALTSTGSTAGDELVPTDLSTELQRRFMLATPMAAIFAAREINMPTNPFDLPITTSVPKFYHESVESTATTESAPGTTKATLTAKKFMGNTDFSYEVEEDSIIAVLPMVQERLSTGAAQAYEDTLINGEVSAGTQDKVDVAGTTISGVTYHHYKAWNGLRYLALAISALKVDFSGSGAVDSTNIMALRKAMGKYGLNPRELILIVGASAYNQLLAITNVQTIEKYGDRATIVQGELTSIYGIPVITSGFCREDVNASGKYDGVTTTLGTVLMLKPSEFLTGVRRDFMVETDRVITTQKMQIVASFRKAFVGLETPSATIRSVAIGYNWTV